MNITDNIQFDNNLIGNETVNLKYDGYLFQNGSDEVTIVYGYDDDWKNTAERKMTKTDDGFVCKINVYNFSSFNFCFKDDKNNEWDNNFGKNFSIPIKRRETSKKFIINENYLPSILSELIEYDVSKVSKAVPENQSVQVVEQADSTENETAPTAEITPPITEETETIDFDSFEDSDFEEDTGFAVSEDDYVSDEEKVRISYVVENYDDIHNNNNNIIKNISEINSSVLIKDRYSAASNNLSILSELLHRSINLYKEYENAELEKIHAENEARIASASSEKDRDFDMNSLVDSLLSPIVSEREVSTDDVKNFNVDDLVQSYVKSFDNQEQIKYNRITVSDFNKVTIEEPAEETAEEPVTESAIVAETAKENSPQFQKISLEELGESVIKGLDESLIDSPVEIYAKVDSPAKKEAAFSPDFAKKKALLDEIDMLFDGNEATENENVEEVKAEQTNEEKLYQLEVGNSVNEDLQEVNRLINETENTIKSIQNLFDEIHTINNEPIVDEVKSPAAAVTEPEETPLFSSIDSLDESIVDSAVREMDFPSEEPVNVGVQKAEISEETSLFNEYENDSNRYPNVLPGQDEDEDEYRETKNTATTEDENKFLIVSNKSLSTTRKIRNKFILPLIKLHKFVSSALGKLFN